MAGLKLGDDTSELTVSGASNEAQERSEIGAATKGKLKGAIAGIGMAVMAASPALAQDLEDPIRDLIERLDLGSETVAAMVVNYEQCIKEELDVATEDGVLDEDFFADGQVFCDESLGRQIVIARQAKTLEQQEVKLAALDDSVEDSAERIRKANERIADITASVIEGAKEEKGFN